MSRACPRFMRLFTQYYNQYKDDGLSDGRIVEELMDTFCLERSQIFNHIRAMKFIERMSNKLDKTLDEKLPPTTCIIIDSAPPEEQENLVIAAIEKGLTGREIKDRIGLLTVSEEALEPPTFFEGDIQEYLEDLFNRYPAITDGDEYQVDKLAKKFDIKYSDAAKAIRGFRKERRKALSSGAKKQVESKPPVEVKVKKPLDLWKHRKAQMSPPISKMEEAVLLNLNAKGYYPDSNIPIPIRTVIPDLRFHTSPPTSFFLDGPVHEGREDRDEELRDLLKKRGDIVVSIKYEAPTKQAIAEVTGQIIAVLKEESE